MSKRTDGPVPRPAERNAGSVHGGHPTPLPDAKPKDADSPAAKPHGTLRDQVSTMESEGQAQPQSDEVPPEERDGSRVVRPDSEKDTGQAPPEDIDNGQPPEGTTRSDKGGTG